VNRRRTSTARGFLNEEWWHRTYWIFGTHFYSGYIGWYFAGREAPAGRLLAMDDTSIYGFSYKPEFYRGATDRQYTSSAWTGRAAAAGPARLRPRQPRLPAGAQGRYLLKQRWSQEVPLLVRAMVLADQTLFLAGPPDSALRSQAVLDGKQGRSCARSPPIRARR